MKTAIVMWLGLLAFVGWMSRPPLDEFWVLVAVTPDGQVYEAGSGGSCNAAWVKPVFPQAVHHVSCKRVR